VRFRRGLQERPGCSYESASSSRNHWSVRKRPAQNHSQTMALVNQVFNERLRGVRGFLNKASISRTACAVRHWVRSWSKVGLFTENCKALPIHSSTVRKRQIQLVFHDSFPVQRQFDIHTKTLIRSNAYMIQPQNPSDKRMLPVFCAQPRPRQAETS